MAGTMLHTLGAGDPNRLRLELIKDAGLSASELVAQVLAFARREALVQEIIEVGPFLRQSLKLVRASIPRASSSMKTWRRRPRG